MCRNFVQIKTSKLSQTNRKIDEKDLLSNSEQYTNHDIYSFTWTRLRWKRNKNTNICVQQTNIFHMGNDFFSFVNNSGFSLILTAFIICVIICFSQPNTDCCQQIIFSLKKHSRQTLNGIQTDRRWISLNILHYDRLYNRKKRRQISSCYLKLRKMFTGNDKYWEIALSRFLCNIFISFIAHIKINKFKQNSYDIFREISPYSTKLSFIYIHLVIFRRRLNVRKFKNSLLCSTYRLDTIYIYVYYFHINSLIEYSVILLFSLFEFLCICLDSSVWYLFLCYVRLFNFVFPIILFCIIQSQQVLSVLLFSLDIFQLPFFIFLSLFFIL